MAVVAHDEELAYVSLHAVWVGRPANPGGRCTWLKGATWGKHRDVCYRKK
jgi:hypothetical protein